MAFLYITEQGAVLRKAYRHLRLIKDKETLLEIPCADVEHVLIFGNIQVTTPALQSLARNNIELAFFSRRGKLLFQLTSRFPKNILLRQQQYRKQADTSFCLGLSRVIVRAKLKSAADVLRGQRNNNPQFACDEALKTIDRMQERARHGTSLKSLLGIEGAAAAAYYKAFGRIPKAPWTFDGRVRRPPRDPVNALLSFGYVIVANEIASLLDGIGFDPFLGFYHTVAYGRNSLALDLLEEFRHSLVDRLVLTILNRRILKPQHFAQTTRDGVHLTREGMQKFFKVYENYVGDYGDEATDKNVGYFRSHFKAQAHKLAATLQTGAAYQPFQRR